MAESVAVAAAPLELAPFGPSNLWMRLKYLRLNAVLLTGLGLLVVVIHQASSRNCRPSAIIAPHSGVGGCGPSPKKLSVAPVRMASTMPVKT